MERVTVWAVVAIVLCSSAQLATADGLVAEESRMSDIIQGVVDRYLGQGRDSSALSLALLDAIQTEGVRSLLNEEDEARQGDHQPSSPSSSSELDRKKEQSQHLDVTKRDAPLPPPELLRDLVDGGLDEPTSVTLVEAAGHARNCTKRKRRRKKPKMSRLGSESRDPAPSFILPGMTVQTQRALTEYSHTGVPPLHVEIPRLTIDEHNYFDATTRSSAFASDGGLFSYSVTQRPGPSKIGEGKTTPYGSSPRPTTAQSSVSTRSSHEPDDVSVPTAYFTLGASTLFPPPPSRANRRNPFLKLERSTPLPLSNPLDGEGLISKGVPTKEPRFETGLTESPEGAGVDLNGRRSKTSFSQEAHLPTRIPQVRSAFTTAGPQTQMSPHRTPSETARDTLLPITTTTMAAAAALSTVADPAPTAAPTPSPRTAEPTQLRTLVPSSLNKGTLQHFSLYPKYQVAGQSKILLAVGGARYAPLPAEIVTSLGTVARTAAPRYDYKTVLTKQTGSASLGESILDSRVIGTPLVELVTKNGKMTMEPIITSGRPTGGQLKPTDPRQPPPSSPPGVLAMSPKVVSGQVLIFSSRNIPDEVDDPAADSNSTEHSATGASPPTASRPIENKANNEHDGLCEHTSRDPDCDGPSALEDRSLIDGDIADTTVTPKAATIGYDDDDERDDAATTTTTPTTTSAPVENGTMASVTVATSTATTNMPQAPTIIMQVPAPELESDTVAHGYARGSTRLHVPFVYHVHKSVLFDKDNVKVRLEDADDEDESPQDEPDETHSKHGSSRTLISLPNNPFARLSPLKADYYKYGRSPVKGYLPKSFLKLERLRDVQVPAGQHRSMLLFE